MIAEKDKGGQKWYANGSETADSGGKPSEGMATETQGREEVPEMYENDVLGKVAKQSDDSIWKRGGMKRKRHREDE